MTPIDTRLQSVCSCYFWEPSTQPGELLAMPLHAGGPGKIHMGWARGTQSWPGAHVLWSLSPWPRFFLAQPHKKESPASVPALQRSGEIGRAQGCLKADTAAGFGRCGQQWWSSGRLPAALAVDPYSIFLGCCPILTYSQTLSKGFTVALTAKTQFVNVVFSPQNQGVFLNQLNRVEVHLPTVKSC